MERKIEKELRKEEKLSEAAELKPSAHLLRKEITAEERLKGDLAQDMQEERKEILEHEAKVEELRKELQGEEALEHTLEEEETIDEKLLLDEELAEDEDVGKKKMVMNDIKELTKRKKELKKGMAS